MLSNFRNLANSGAAKALLLLVAATFVLWGVGDILRQGNKNIVIKVGDKEITDYEWHRYFNNAISNFEKMSGKKITKEELKANNVVDIIAHQIIDSSLIQLESQNMGLLVSDEMVGDRISKIPEFQKNNKFDKGTFKDFLAKNHVAEEAFVSNLKDSMQREMLLSPFYTIHHIPTSLKQELLKARTLNHSLLIAKIDLNSIPLDKQPTDDELKASYELHKNNYALQDKRSISYVTFNPKDIKVNENITDDILKEQYAQKSDYYGDPEQRLVDMLMFTSEEDANAAWKSITAGEDFNTTGKKYFPDKTDFSMGFVTKSGFDKITAAAIFGTELNKISSVTKTPLGYVIFKINEIKPPRIKPFEEVKEQVKAEYLNEIRFEELAKIGQEIDKASASGAKLADIVSKYNFKVSTVTNLTQTSQPQEETTRDSNFLNAAFSTPVNQVSHLTPFAGKTDNFFILQVDSSTGRGFRSFDEARDDVLKSWALDQKRRVLDEKLLNIKKEIELGAKFDELAVSLLQAKVSNLTLNMFDQDYNYPHGLIADSFRIKLLELTDTYQDTKDANISYVAQLKLIEPGKVDNSHENMMDFELSRSFANEAILAFIQSLRKKYNIIYSRELAAKLVGVE